MNNKLKIKISLAVAILGCFIGTKTYAGNPDRAGEAGATQLVINPWARSSGMAGANMAYISGVESMNFNVAGLSNTKGTELNLSRSSWLGGAVGININSFGFATRLGNSTDTSGNTLALSIVSYDFGSIPITTEANPDGGIGSYKVQMLNIGIGYSHWFSRNISGGILARIVSEGIPNATASGIALDAGLQYRAGKFDRTHFGVSLRNIGPPMQYSGDGLSSRGVFDGYSNSMTIEARTSKFEMPTVLSVAASYDIIADTGYANKLTLGGGFVSNAFDKDQLVAGLQFDYKRHISLRAGYVYEAGITSSTVSTDKRSNVYSGPSAGVSLNMPFSHNKRLLSLDYSYRVSNPFSGTHTFGLRVVI